MVNVKSLLTMNFLFGSLWRSKTKRITRWKELKPFQDYCQSGYRFLPKMENYNLEKIMVVFRHGARAPTRNMPDEWRSQNCMSCMLKGSMISSCQKKECSEGELTYRGFEQMVGLGRFIKKSYKALLFDKEIKQSNIKMRATRIPRTQASLAGVIKGLIGDTTLKNVKIPQEDDSLIVNVRCAIPEEKQNRTALFNKPEIVQDSKILKSHPGPLERADQYYTSMCSGVSIDCKELSCVVGNVVDHMKAANDNWMRTVSLGSRDRQTRRKVFGRFARDLLLDMGEDKQILLYSAHDSSISAILAGLDTGVAEWPSYASAFFIEIWCNTGKQYVRLVLNGRVVKPREFPEEYIPIKRFVRILGTISPPPPKKKNPETGVCYEQHRVISM